MPQTCSILSEEALPCQARTGAAPEEALGTSRAGDEVGRPLPSARAAPPFSLPPLGLWKARRPAGSMPSQLLPCTPASYSPGATRLAADGCSHLLQVQRDGGAGSAAARDSIPATPRGTAPRTAHADHAAHRQGGAPLRAKVQRQDTASQSGLILAGSPRGMGPPLPPWNSSAANTPRSTRSSRRVLPTCCSLWAATRPYKAVGSGSATTTCWS